MVYRMKIIVYMNTVLNTGDSLNQIGGNEREGEEEEKALLSNNKRWNHSDSVESGVVGVLPNQIM